ncbi:unnamed protein product [Dovyalis caffra]|uniref:Uncharacterized protein n=1 Tax=Dovyalis caffra TaxID=77055 RepID=A0AAV1RF43_9ROSI|nr:unnamed protein product [Dovyalis caffra]
MSQERKKIKEKKEYLKGIKTCKTISCREARKREADFMGLIQSRRKRAVNIKRGGDEMREEVEGGLGLGIRAEGVGGDEAQIDQSSLEP